MIKYAIIIGINYKGSSKYLPGCMNDVITIYKTLINWGFQTNNIIVLADDIQKSDIIKTSIIQPTSFNINQSLGVFVKQFKNGDSGVIYYTGHGMRTKIGNKRIESCIVPIDYKKSGVVSSESIRYYLNKIPSEVNIFCLFDCCNSGTICDLKYHYYDTSYRKNVKVKLRKFDYTDWNFRQNTQLFNNEVDTPSSLSIDTNANIVSISGCWDTQVSYDLGRNGALTMAFMKVIGAYDIKLLKFKHLLQDLRGTLSQMHITQTPQLMCGKNLELNYIMGSFLNV